MFKWTKKNWKLVVKAELSNAQGGIVVENIGFYPGGRHHQQDLFYRILGR